MRDDHDMEVAMRYDSINKVSTFVESASSLPTPCHRLHAGTLQHVGEHVEVKVEEYVHASRTMETTPQPDISTRDSEDTFEIPEPRSPVASTSASSRVNKESARRLLCGIISRSRQLASAVASSAAAKQLAWMFPPTNIAAALAAVVGLVPTLQRSLFGAGAPLYFASDALATLGAAMIPATLIALGATMYKGPGRG